MSTAAMESQGGLAGVLDKESRAATQPAAHIESLPSTSSIQTQGKAKRKLALHVAYCGTGFKGQPRILPAHTAQSLLPGV